MQITPAFTVAVSGPDNVGKTTQARLLARRYGARNLGPLDDYDPRWQEAKRHGLAAWWMESAPLAEVVDVLARSYLARSNAARADTSAPFSILDRGMTMLEASVVATAAARDHLSHPAAAERADQLLAPYAADITQARQAEHEVVLLHDGDPLCAAEIALSRERAVTPVYRRYQHALNEHLHRHTHDSAVIVGDQSILTAHSTLCARLRQKSPPIAPLVITGRWTVALGGMSECGKSTTGAYLQHQHKFTRLKIGYLLECAAHRHDIRDVYALPPVEQAELLALELDHYAHAHHYQQRFSIESLHSAELTAELAKLLGAALTVVYLDAFPARRRQRGTSGPDDVTERDTTKRARGADRVQQIADVVIDNNRTHTELGHALDRLVRGRLWQARPPRVVPTQTLGLPAHLAAFLDRMIGALTAPASGVDMVAVTGSGARGKYLQGWSDLDVLIVADSSALPAIGAAQRDTRARLAGVKLGLTVITRGECQTGALTSRLLYTIASIASGAMPVLWARSGFCLTQPDADLVLDRTRHDGATAAMDLRRVLLREPVDLRAVYKVAALLAKITLACEGQAHPADADAIEAFTKLAGLPAVAPGPRLDASATIAVAEQILAWWLNSLEPVA